MDPTVPVASAWELPVSHLTTHCSACAARATRRAAKAAPAPENTSEPPPLEPADLLDLLAVDDTRTPDPTEPRGQPMSSNDFPAHAHHDDRTPDPTTPGATSAFQQSWADLHAQTVRVLTAACRLRFPRTHSDGTTAAPGPVDFADFLASVLAGVAANVGSIDRLTAGRPEAWEADLVHQLVAGTVGYDETWLYEHRTEPVVVPLNVPALAWDLPGFPDHDEALEAALQPFYAATDPTPDGQSAEWTDEQWDALEAAREATETAVLDTYARLYRDYADAFTTAVQTAAAQLPALAAAGIPVAVQAVHDPRTQHQDAERVTNPVDELEFGPCDDVLVARLWSAAAAAVQIPPAPVLGGPS